MLPDRDISQQTRAMKDLNKDIETLTRAINQLNHTMIESFKIVMEEMKKRKDNA